ncbi:MAG TPA: AMIN domain-containing protein, partial [Candidatus Acidoferrales bacterium]|nr:AMIN domain-containing protein [Candidatus Acidoferrales bacterium]
MRMIRQSWGLALLLAAGLIWTAGSLSAESAPVVQLNSEVKDGVVRLVAQSTSPFEYTTSRPNRSLFVLDLSGVTANAPTAARTVDSSLVTGYRVLSYGGVKPVVRVEIRMNPDAEAKVERGGAMDLTVIVQPSNARGPAVGTSEAAPAAAATLKSTIPGIENVQLGQVNGDTEVNVTGTTALNYHVSRLAHPDRIVLDFSGAQIKIPDHSIASNLDPVRAIRLAQFSPEVARVVIELRATAPYTVNAKGNTVTVEFVGGSATKGSTKTGNDASSSTLNRNPQAGPASSLNAANAQIVPVSSPAVVLPASLTQPSAALATPVDTKNSLAATATPDNANSSKAGANSQQAATPAASNRYSGEPISVNLKDVDVRDFFRLIHEISGLNVVVDPNVKGSLTIVLDDVPWDQALDIVLHNNDLEKQLDGNVLRIATRETIKREAEEARELAQAQAEAADIVTTTRVLSYAKTADMVLTLKKFSSSRGDVIGDQRSNTIIIRDIPSVLPVMDNLIR